jgi:hypothetical protein
MTRETVSVKPLGRGRIVCLKSRMRAVVTPIVEADLGRAVRSVQQGATLERAAADGGLAVSTLHSRVAGRVRPDGSRQKVFGSVGHLRRSRWSLNSWRCCKTPRTASFRSRQPSLRCTRARFMLCPGRLPRARAAGVSVWEVLACWRRRWRSSAPPHLCAPFSSSTQRAPPT